MKDKIKCEICLNYFKGLAGHLKSKHNISTLEYKKIYKSETLPETYYQHINNSKVKKCIICNGEFSPKDSRNITCSKECRYKHTSYLRSGKKRSNNYITVFCKNCGKEDYIKKYKDINHFCDKLCYNKFHSVKKNKVKCKYESCENYLYVSEKETKKYCSRLCYKKGYNEDRQNFNSDSRYKKGYYISMRNGKKMWYDSSWELKRMKKLDNDKNVIEWSKNKLKIKYKGEDGNYHIYTPDLLVIYKDGTRVIEEIKGRMTTRDVLKMEYAIPFLKKMNIKYRLIQKIDIFEKNYIEPIIEEYQNKFGEFQRISILSSFIQMISDLSERSTCIRKKVGCLITPHDYRNISSIGYNGSLPGEENGCQSIESGKCGCVHAEMNALNKFENVDNNMTYHLLCTLSPCLNCSKEILKYPISKVIYLNSYRDTYGIKYLRDNNVEVVKYEDIVKEKNKRYEL
jgi:dCMP deaminase